MEKTITKTAFGDMLMLTNGNMSIGITTKLGLRISHISAFGSENICFFDSEFVQTAMIDDIKWLQLGGHRLWKTPEDNDCYVYDNFTADYSLTDNGVVMNCGKRGDMLDFKMQLIFTSDHSLSLNHIITNNSPTTKTFGLWGITALKHCGQIFLPYHNVDTGLLPNRNLVFWPYTDIADKRINYNNKGITITPKKAKPLKLGLHNPNGKIVFIGEDIIFTKKCDTPIGVYPDKDCNIECYTNKDILEMETLSPIYEVKPQQTISHKEIWTFERR